MKIYVAGATGVIGRQLVPMLMSAKHSVTALTRSDDKAALLRRQGVNAVVGDAYQPDTLHVHGHDVVVQLLTDLSGGLPARGGTPSTDRIRTEGTRRLIAAADTGAVHIAESVAFAYAPAPGLRVETDPLWAAAPGGYGPSWRAIEALEHQLLDAHGAVLRCGWLYGPHTGFAPGGATFARVAKRAYPVVGAGDGVWSFAHVHDAATAFLAAVEQRAQDVFNIVDDEPAAMRDWLPAYAQAVGAPPPLRIPGWVARLMVGPTAVMARSFTGASNAKAKRRLGWTPSYPTWRDGFRTPTAAGDRAKATDPGSQAR